MKPVRLEVRSRGLLVWKGLLSAALVLLSVTGCDKDGCKSDADCKGQRICQEGKCVEPLAAPTLPGAAATKQEGDRPEGTVSAGDSPASPQEEKGVEEAPPVQMMAIELSDPSAVDLTKKCQKSERLRVSGVVRSPAGAPKEKLFIMAIVKTNDYYWQPQEELQFDEKGVAEWTVNAIFGQPQSKGIGGELYLYVLDEAATYTMVDKYQRGHSEPPTPRSKAQLPPMAMKRCL